MNDERLIDEALAGRTEAFGELVLKYQDRLFHSVRHVLGSADDAVEIVQDGLVQALVKLETFQRTSSFYTWLYRITMNLALSRRRRRREVASLDALRNGAGHEPLDGSPAPDAHLHQQQRASLVQAALATLPEEFRAVVVLRDMDELSYEQISEILDLPIGTVRSRLHRGRLQLREQLKETSAATHEPA